MTQSSPENAQKVLLLTVQGIGNTILSLPVIYALKAKGYGVDLLLSDNGSSNLVHFLNVADQIFIWHENHNLLVNLFRLGLFLQFHHYDTVYALSPAGRRENLLLRLAKARSKRGWRSSERWRLLAFNNPALPFWNEKKHDLLSNQDLVSLEDSEIEIALRKVRDQFRELNEKTTQKMEKMKIGAQPLSHVRSKCWSFENFKNFLILLREQFEFEVCFFGSYDEASALSQFAASLPMEAEIKAGLTWREVTQHVNELDFFIGVDSAMSHLSAICGIPTCILYGVTNPERTCALGENVLIIQDNNSTAASYQFAKGYAKDQHSLELRVEDVLESVIPILRFLKQNPKKFDSSNILFPQPIEQLPFGAKLRKVILTR